MQFFANRRKSDQDDEITVDAEVVPDHAPFDTGTHKHAVGFDTVLGPGSVTDGTLHTEGNIRLDGEFKGTLGIAGNVLVGESARIEADIEARNISIAGSVRGNVTGNRVQILNTGRVLGDITAHTLTTDEGAFIDGKVSMIADEPELAADSLDDSAEESESNEAEALFESDNAADSDQEPKSADEDTETVEDLEDDD